MLGVPALVLNAWSKIYHYLRKYRFFQLSIIVMIIRSIVIVLMIIIRSIIIVLMMIIKSVIIIFMMMIIRSGLSSNAVFDNCERDCCEAFWDCYQGREDRP